ncbi:MAG: hypothetical protein HQK51_12645 [Oligoflexia bacterium]|nr:hypothetical protein [Oligoflexia bacterium]
MKMFCFFSLHIFLLILNVSCSKKLSLDYNKRRVECGFKNPIEPSAKVLQIYGAKDEIIDRELKNITIGSKSILSRLSNQGCFYLLESEKGELKVITKADAYAYWTKLDDNSNLAPYEKIYLEKYPTIKDNLIKDKIFETLCSSSPGETTVSTTKDSIPYTINLFDEKLKRGTKLTLTILQENASKTLYQETKNTDEKFEISIKDVLNVITKNNNRLQYKVSFKDIFEEEEGKNCFIQYDQSPGNLIELNGIKKFRNIYYGDPSDGIELVFKKDYPLTRDQININLISLDRPEEKINVDSFFLSNSNEKNDLSIWKLNIKISPRNGMWNLQITIGDDQIYKNVFEYKIDFGHSYNQNSPISKLILDPNEKFVIANSSETGNAKVIELASAKELLSFTSIYKDGIALSSDSKKIAICRKTIFNSNKLWQLSVYDIDTEKRTNYYLENECSNLLFDKNNEKIIFFEENNIKNINFFNIKTEKLTNKIFLSDNICKYAKSNSSNSYLMLGCLNGNTQSGIKVIDLNKEKEISFGTTLHNNVNFLITNQDCSGARCLLGDMSENNELIASAVNEKLKIYNLHDILEHYLNNSSEDYKIRELVSYSHFDKIEKIKFSADSKWLFSLASDIKLFRLDQNKLYNKIPINFLPHTIDFYPLNDYIMIGHEDGNIYVYNLENMQIVQQLNLRSKLTNAQFTSKGTYIVAYDNKGNIQIEKCIFSKSTLLTTIELHQSGAFDLSNNYYVYENKHMDILDESLEDKINFYNLNNHTTNIASLDGKGDKTVLSKNAKYFARYLNKNLELYLIIPEINSLKKLWNTNVEDISDWRFCNESLLMYKDGINKNKITFLKLNTLEVKQFIFSSNIVANICSSNFDNTILIINKDQSFKYIDTKSMSIQYSGHIANESRVTAYIKEESFKMCNNQDDICNYFFLPTDNKLVLQQKYLVGDIIIYNLYKNIEEDSYLNRTKIKSISLSPSGNYATLSFPEYKLQNVYNVNNPQEELFTITDKEQIYFFNNEQIILVKDKNNHYFKYDLLKKNSEYIFPFLSFDPDTFTLSDVSFSTNDKFISLKTSSNMIYLLRNEM